MAARKLPEESSQQFRNDGAKESPACSDIAGQPLEVFWFYAPWPRVAAIQVPPCKQCIPPAFLGCQRLVCKRPHKLTVWVRQCVCVCVRARAHGTCNRKMRCRTYLVVTPSTLSKLYALFASGDLRIDLGRSAASNMMEWVSLFRSSEEIDIIAGILSRFKCYFKKAQQEGSSDPAQL
jgi:hypothetical protein